MATNRTTPNYTGRSPSVVVGYIRSGTWSDSYSDISNIASPHNALQL